MEAAIGVGTIIGPAVGSFMYGIFGFAASFYIRVVIFLIAFAQSYYFIPKRLNFEAEKVDDNKLQTLIRNEKLILER